MNDPSEKVCIFLPGLYGGGAERAMLKLAEGIASRGHAVDLMVSRAEGPFLAEVPKSVRLVDLNASRVLASLPPLVSYMRREKPAALLSVLHANIIALWARRLARVPTRVVVSERNTLSYRAKHHMSDLRMRLAPHLIKYFYPWADGIVAVSTGVADDLSRVTGIPRQRIQVIYNPIVTPELRGKKEVPIKHPWFRNGQPPVILAVGRLTRQKDFRTLIAAFAQVRKYRSARLLILGEGEERRSLEAMVKKLGVESDVSLPGFVQNPYPYMAKSSLFVLSSRWEGLPGVLIEALYCGTSLVSTDCPSGPREILADGKYGQLVPVGDVDALSQVIAAALNRRPGCPFKESWQLFELENVVSQYMHILLGM
jgi:glycosyltransferase involved in cell wall biosynthesis